MKKITLKETGLCLELNTNDFTAIIIESPKVKGEIYILRSLTHESKEYVIKAIKEGSFKYNNKIKIIKFAEDSEISSIGLETFALCLFDSILKFLNQLQKSQKIVFE